MHHYSVIRFQTVVDDPKRSDLPADFDRANRRLVIGTHNGNLITSLKFFDCGLRNQQGLSLAAGLNTHASVLPGTQRIALVVPVSALTERLAALQASGAIPEHVFDY